MDIQDILEETIFDFIGGNAAVDFVNIEIMHDGERVDLIPDFAHFSAWLDQAGLMDHHELFTKLKKWHMSVEVEELMVNARQLCSTLRGTFEQISKKQTVEVEKLNELNDQLRLYTGFYQLERRDNRIYQQFVQNGTMPSYLLSPLAKEIADFLSEADLSLIKCCGNPQCIRYFYDTTRNRSRRWCSMETCGNRMKVAAYYQRKRESS